MPKPFSTQELEERIDTTGMKLQPATISLASKPETVGMMVFLAPKVKSLYTKVCI